MVEVDEYRDRRTDADGHDDSEHAVAPAPPLVVAERRHNLARVPGVDNERRGQQRADEGPPLEAREIGDDEVVEQIKATLTDGTEDGADDVGGERRRGGDDDVAHDVERDDEQVSVRPGRDVGNFRDEGLRYRCDDTRRNRQRRETTAVRVVVGGGERLVAGRRRLVERVRPGADDDGDRNRPEGSPALLALGGTADGLHARYTPRLDVRLGGARLAVGVEVRRLLRRRGLRFSVDDGLLILFVFGARRRMDGLCHGWYFAVSGWSTWQKRDAHLRLRGK